MAVTQDTLLAFLARQLRRKQIAADAEMGKTPGWDSMAQVEMILTLEQEFGVQVPPDMFGQLTSVASLMTFLNQGSAA